MATSVVVKKDNQVYVEQEQLDIVSLLSYGFTAQQVSEKMKIGVRTIESKIAKLKRELNCKTVTQLCCFCIRYKLIK
jgi:DNA-binding NarL/FixJ family response regulator